MTATEASKVIQSSASADPVEPDSHAGLYVRLSSAIQAASLLAEAAAHSGSREELTLLENTRRMMADRDTQAVLIMAEALVIESLFAQIVRNIMAVQGIRKGSPPAPERPAPDARSEQEPGENRCHGGAGFRPDFCVAPPLSDKHPLLNPRLHSVRRPDILTRGRERDASEKG